MEKKKIEWRIIILGQNLIHKNLHDIPLLLYFTSHLAIFHPQIYQASNLIQIKNEMIRCWNFKGLLLKPFH
jgi:hypothetical protein